MKYILLFLPLLLFSCKKDNIVIPKAIENTISDDEVTDELPYNHLQLLGSHNSYKPGINPELLAVLSTFQSIVPNEISELDYGHETLESQFSDYGIRQIEIDVFADTDGGRFANRRGQGMIGEEIASNLPALDLPGTKVIHLPDVDFETYYLTFIDALNTINDWSNAHPNHFPIFVLIEAKDETAANYNDLLAQIGFAEAEPWNTQNLALLEQEILQVMNEDDILTPSFVRGNFGTLNEAITTVGWPVVGEVRGKVAFAFINESITSFYNQIHPNLNTRLIFTNETVGAPNSAFITQDNPSDPIINQLAEDGYLIRTRVDAGTYEARNNDYSRWNDALLSGAHFFSTDYYRPDPRNTSSSEWSSYSVGFNNGLYRNNPVTGE